MGERITLQRVRISFPHLHQPRAAVAGAEPRYSAEFIIPANHPAVAQIQAAIQKLITEELKGVQPTAVIPFYQGEQKYPQDPRYQGHYVLRAAAKTKPHVVDQNVQPVIDPGLIYPGCYVNAAVSAYVYTTPQRGIAFGLDGVQFVSDGERLDNRPTAEQLFGVVEGAPPPVAPGVGQTAPAPAAPAPAAPAPAAQAVDPITGMPIPPSS